MNSRSTISLLLILFVSGSFFCITGCGDTRSADDGDVPVIGFLDYLQDPTIEQAKTGFFDALAKEGFSEADETIKIVYSNAQGDIPVLNQACDRIIAVGPDLIAANVTLSTITAVSKTDEIPVFMIVSPRPDLAGLTDESGNAPANLSGVYEDLAYIDTSIAIIKQALPEAESVATIYNQSEPQSVDAFNVLSEACERMELELRYSTVNNSSESQLVTLSLLDKGADVFFALPDNVIFASFETIVDACNKADVPVFTSESGLVSRGAVASYGADFYQWGYQAGMMAARYLQGNELDLPEQVLIRKRIFNEAAATRFGINIPEGSERFN